jgi:hypothetical protein
LETLLYYDIELGREYGDQILDHGQMWERIHANGVFAVTNGCRASQGIRSVDIHGAGTTNPLSAGTPER